MHEESKENILLLINDTNANFSHHLSNDIKQIKIVVDTEKPLSLKLYSDTKVQIINIFISSKKNVRIQKIILDNASIEGIHFDCTIHDLTGLLDSGIRRIHLTTQTDFYLFEYNLSKNRYIIASNKINIECKKHENNLSKVFFKIGVQDTPYIILVKREELDVEELYDNFNMDHNRKVFPIELYKSNIELTVKDINAEFFPSFPYIIFEECHLKLNIDKSFSCLVLQECIVNLVTKNNEIVKEFDLIFWDYFSYQHFNDKSQVKDLILKFETEQLSLFKRRQQQDILNFIFFKIITLEFKLIDLFKAMIVLIILGSFVFTQIDMQPKDSITGQNYLLNSINKNHPELNVESKQGWSYTEGYMKFNSLFYSLDVAIPFLNLGQESSWIPIFDDSRKTINLFYYFYKIVTKILSFCLLFGFIKKLDFRYEQKNKQ